MDAERYSIPQAIQRLFGISVASESPYLRQVANSLVRNGTVRAVKELTGERRDRSAVFLPKGELCVLHNALVIQAFWSDPAKVRRVFEETGLRHELAQFVSALLGARDSLFGAALREGNTKALAEALTSGADLRTSWLPNPFSELPQKHLNGDASLVCAVLAQVTSLSAGDNLLLAYLSDDLPRAREHALALGDAAGELGLLRDKVLRESADTEALGQLIRKLVPR